MIALALACLAAPPPDIYAHYMPWYQAKPVSQEWGWHWTMGHFRPDEVKDARHPIASKYYPEIGPYDSSDPAVIEYQVLNMKIAGLAGAMIDWYGREEVYDYAINHKHTLAFIAQLKKAKMKYAVVLEDSTLPNLIKFGKVKESEAVAYGKGLLDWMSSAFFADPSYLKDDGVPIMPVFGPQYYKAEHWKELLTGRNLRVYGVNGSYSFENGGFSWPAPREKADYFPGFYKRASAYSTFIAGAYPRFNDIYEEAKVHPSWGSISDDGGKTFRSTLELAWKSGSKWIQIATWNDWGEGTQIEPSKEFGTRDLEVVQNQVKKGNPKLPYTAKDFDLPLLIYKLRKQRADSKVLDKASEAIVQGHIENSRIILSTLNK